MPELTAAVCVPRLAGIEFPMNRTLGPPGDHQTQLAVLQAVLACAAEMTTPGSVKQLPFEWTVPQEKRRPAGLEAPPIAKLLMRAPWQLQRLMHRDLPEMAAKP